MEIYNGLVYSNIYVFLTRIWGFNPLDFDVGFKLILAVAGPRGGGGGATGAPPLKLDQLCF